MKTQKMFQNGMVLVVAALSAGSAYAQTNGECEAGPAVVAKMTAAEGERLTCLDSVVTGDRIRAVVLSTRVETTASGGRNEIEMPIVVDGTVAGTEVTISASRRLEEPTLSQNGCGQYLMGGRVLPGAEKIVLIYAQKLRVVDFSQAAIRVEIANDTSIPGMASTCQGYSPNWGAEREEFSVDAAARTMIQKITSRETVEQPELKKISKPEEFKFYRRAYAIQCGVGSPERASQECKDLKRARDEGVFVIRKHVRPVNEVSVRY